MTEQSMHVQEQDALKELIEASAKLQFPDANVMISQAFIQGIINGAINNAFETLIQALHVVDPDAVSRAKRDAFAEAAKRISQATRAAPRIQVAGSINGHH